MSKTIKSLLIVIVIAFIIWSWLVGKYNGMVNLDVSVKTARSQVENVYQRRMDLIPNLVNTVKGYATHEASTLEAVVQARASATKLTVDLKDAESLAKFQQAQGDLSSALGKLLMITENYPDLKANQNFLELQAQLEGTENRITVERKNFNDTVKSYNTFIRVFPNNIIAGFFNFQAAQLFEAQDGAEKAPVVDFTK